MKLCTGHSVINNGVALSRRCYFLCPTVLYKCRVNAVLMWQMPDATLGKRRWKASIRNAAVRIAVINR